MRANGTRAERASAWATWQRADVGTRNATAARERLPMRCLVFPQATRGLRKVANRSAASP
jgi:hypothetical protein